MVAARSEVRQKGNESTSSQLTGILRSGRSESECPNSEDAVRTEEMENGDVAKGLARTPK